MVEKIKIKCAVIMINGLGLDKIDYQWLKSSSTNIKIFAITLTGFEENAIDNSGISIESHSEELVAFISSISNEYDCNYYLLWGFSYGAELWAYTVSKNHGRHNFSPRSIIPVLNDPNVDVSTCTISKCFSKYPKDSSRRQGLGACLRVVATSLNNLNYSLSEASDTIAYISIIAKKSLLNVSQIAIQMVINAENRRAVKDMQRLNELGYKLFVYYSSETMWSKHCRLERIEKVDTVSWIKVLNCGHFDLNKPQHQKGSINAVLRFLEIEALV